MQEAYNSKLRCSKGQNVIPAELSKKIKALQDAPRPAASENDNGGVLNRERQEHNQMVSNIGGVGTFGLVGASDASGNDAISGQSGAVSNSGVGASDASGNDANGGDANKDSNKASNEGLVAASDASGNDANGVNGPLPAREPLAEVIASHGSNVLGGIAHSSNDWCPYLNDGDENMPPDLSGFIQSNDNGNQFEWDSDYDWDKHW